MWRSIYKHVGQFITGSSGANHRGMLIGRSSLTNRSEAASNFSFLLISRAMTPKWQSSEW